MHFDVPADHKVDEEAAQNAILELAEVTLSGDKSMDDSMMEVVEAQKRVLDQWCFAEHYEPHVLLQVSLGFGNGMAGRYICMLLLGGENEIRQFQGFLMTF